MTVYLTNIQETEKERSIQVETLMSKLVCFVIYSTETLKSFFFPFCLSFEKFVGVL